jgi:hypothetical protein
VRRAVLGHVGDDVAGTAVALEHLEQVAAALPGPATRGEGATAYVEAGGDLGQQVAVAAPTEGRIEIDEMDPLRAVLLPGQRRLERIAVRRFSARRPLHEAHRLAAGHVHRRQELKCPDGRGRPGTAARAGALIDQETPVSKPGKPIGGCCGGRAEVSGVLPGGLGQH